MLFLSYVMSVIVVWVLLDVCDGLKLVYWWIFYGMSELGVMLDKLYKKLVWIVGDVMGKYYFYGDFVIYELMVWMV